ncbi:hypothetical protein [Roseovarius pelagicus]|uniref:Uncharacterized protein n=1 Tax=Roseovarius pelagicus TaxID=2980108 RepID=A0ABY6D7L8_9RHOB|nr:MULTISPECIES: hypothetical protein [Rhodobacterales]UXX82132.1 hypothetical protein N7U68_13595 [Roseovarius pelagicus]
MIPSLVLPSVASDTAQTVVILALLAGALVFIEYHGQCPSIVGFRFAPPYNRLKFGFIALTVLIMSLIARGMSDPGSWTILLTGIGRSIGHALDFPYSPIRLLLVLLPSNSDVQTIDLLRIYAGLSYALSITMVLAFVGLVRLWGWPVRRQAFNVWLNLPLFDPTGGGDVVERLNRDAAINISLGFLLPFLLPAAVLVMSRLFNHFDLLGPQSLIWMTCAWSFVPASMIMRGIATNRIAELITAKRRRAYARAEADAKDGLQPV